MALIFQQRTANTATDFLKTARTVQKPKDATIFKAPKQSQIYKEGELLAEVASFQKQTPFKSSLYNSFLIKDAIECEKSNKREMQLQIKQGEPFAIENMQMLQRLSTPQTRHYHKRPDSFVTARSRRQSSNLDVQTMSVRQQKERQMTAHAWVPSQFQQLQGQLGQTIRKNPVGFKIRLNTESVPFREPTDKANKRYNTTTKVDFITNTQTPIATQTSNRKSYYITDFYQFTHGPKLDGRFAQSLNQTQAYNNWQSELTSPFSQALPKTSNMLRTTHRTHHAHNHFILKQSEK